MITTRLKKLVLNALGLNTLIHNTRAFNTLQNWLRRKDRQDWQELSDYMKRDCWPDG